MTSLRCVVIGAGVSGLLIIHRLKEAFGEDISIQAFEKNVDLGGTWFENRYPGCACDVPSHVYQYSFAPNPYWSRPFAGSAEIQRYLKSFARHFDVEKHIKFSSKVTKAEWDESRSVWSVEVDGCEHYECEVLFNAGGILNNISYPRLKNLDKFQGSTMHTAAWDTDADLRGKRVAIIGSGATAIQLLPALQPYAAHIDIYIRTPSWITDPMGLGMVPDDLANKDYIEEEILRYANDTTYSLEKRKAMEAVFNTMYQGFFKNSREQGDMQKKLDARMREVIRDKHLQEKLIPKFEAGCRRLNPGKPYLEALQMPNVTPIFDPIEEITSHGIRAGTNDNPHDRKVDVIILATGFDTSFRPRFPIIGRNGHNLQEIWQHDPIAYFGTAVSGFPNYLIFLGPNTPISNGSLMGSIEATADHFVRLLTKMKNEHVASFDVLPEAQADFDRHTQEFMQKMVWTGSCRSWTKLNGTGKVTAIWPGSSLHYRQVLAADRYEDFRWKYKGNRFACWGDGFSTVETEGDPQDRDLSYYIAPAPNLPAELFDRAVGVVSAKSSTAPSTLGSVDVVSVPVLVAEESASSIAESEPKGLAPLDDVAKTPVVEVVVAESGEIKAVQGKRVRLTQWLRRVSSTR